MTVEGTWTEFTPEERGRAPRPSAIPGALVLVGILLLIVAGLLLDLRIGLTLAGLFALKMSGAWKWPSPWPPRRPRD